MSVVAEKIMEREGSGSPYSIVVVAEGASEAGGSLIYQETTDIYHAPRLGGIGDHCRLSIEKLTGKESRCVVLGHLQRGGRPNAFDRVLATDFGACAVRVLLEGQRAVMVALVAGEITTVPISEAITSVKAVPPDSQLIRTARDTGISFGAPDELSHHPRANHRESMESFWAPEG